MFRQLFPVRTLEFFVHLKLDMLTSAQLSRKYLPGKANDSLRTWTAQFWLHLLLQPFAVILFLILNQWVLVLTSFEAVCFRSRTAELTISAIALPSGVKKDIFSSSPRSWKKKELFAFFKLLPWRGQLQESVQQAARFQKGTFTLKPQSLIV